MKNLHKIGLGGGCHWCTEAVFQSLQGVEKVEQGYISTVANPEIFCEGVLVSFDPEFIDLEKLIDIHLQTHQSTSNHSMRAKYLSAVYSFTSEQHSRVEGILNKLQKNYAIEFVTKAYHFGDFKASRKEIWNYYKTDPERPFCKIYIEPKLNLVRQKFTEQVKK
ncbi:MAG: peptide-methionine (S)-S-oxide reductase [Christiangramia sp.]